MQVAKGTVGKNLVAIHGKSYVIPPEAQDEFFEHYASSRIEEGFAYVPQPQGRTSNTMTIDLDFRFLEDTHVVRERYTHFIDLLLPSLDPRREYKIILCESERPAYLKEKMKRKRKVDPEVGSIWKAGPHFFACRRRAV